MSGKEGSSKNSKCASGSTTGHFAESQRGKEQSDIPRNLTESASSSFKFSEKCVYDSKHTDSGVWSGSNIHSEEIQSLDPPDSSKTSDFTPMPYSESATGDNKSSAYMRLDSGIDVSQHLSELSLKDNSDSYNDLSVKDVIVSSKDAICSIPSCTKPSDSSSRPTTPSDSSLSTRNINLVDYCFQQDEDGDTDLHIAIVHKFIEPVYALVRLVPNPTYLNIRNNDRQTPLHLAVLTQQPRLVRLLVCAGVALDELDRFGNTALHLAVQACNLACVQAIIAPVTVPETYQAQLRYTPHFTNRVIANIYNYEGQTCLHLAALSGCLDIFKHLLWTGADINAKEWKGGQTCLHLAVERRDLDLCVFLLSQEQMDVEETSYAGHTAYRTACSGWDLVIADTLRKHGVDTYDSDSEDDGVDNDDNDMLESGYNGLQVNGSGLVDVGA